LDLNSRANFISFVEAMRVSGSSSGSSQQAAGIDVEWGKVEEFFINGNEKLLNEDEKQAARSECKEASDDWDKFLTTVILVCTLLMSLMFTPQADTLRQKDVCEDHHESNSVWGSCSRTAAALNSYRLVSYTCALSSAFGSLSGTMLYLNLVKIKKARTAHFVTRIGYTAMVPNAFMGIAIYTFVVTIILQASIVLEWHMFLAVLIMSLVMIGVVFYAECGVYKPISAEYLNVYFRRVIPTVEGVSAKCHE